MDSGIEIKHAVRAWKLPCANGIRPRPCARRVRQLLSSGREAMRLELNDACAAPQASARRRSRAPSRTSSRADSAATQAAATGRSGAARFLDLGARGSSGSILSTRAAAALSRWRERGAQHEHHRDIYVISPWHQWRENGQHEQIFVNACDQRTCIERTPGGLGAKVRAHATRDAARGAPRRRRAVAPLKRKTGPPRRRARDPMLVAMRRRLWSQDVFQQRERQNGKRMIPAAF